MTVPAADPAGGPPLRIRTATAADVAALTELTVRTFEPFYEGTFRHLVGEDAQRAFHGRWREDYARMVPELVDGGGHLGAVLTEADGGLAGWAAYSWVPEHGTGELTMLAVDPDLRRGGVATALCEHVFAALRSHGVRHVEIATGGDAFHRPARGFYESLGCTLLPVSVYYKDL